MKNLCKCGCGEEVRMGNRYVYGHRYRKRKKNHFFGKQHSPESKKKMSDAKKFLWENATVKQRNKLVKRLLRKHLKVTITKSEQQLLILLDTLYPDQWEYVGNGKLIINGKCPDFACSTQRKIIELHAWDTSDKTYSQQRKEHFAKYGYKTLILINYHLQKKPTLTEFRIHKFMRI